MITSLTEMLYLPNFDQMTTSTIQFESRDKILLVTLWTGIMTSVKGDWELFFQANLCQAG